MTIQVATTTHGVSHETAVTSTFTPASIAAEDPAATLIVSGTGLSASSVSSVRLVPSVNTDCSDSTAPVTTATSLTPAMDFLSVTATLGGSGLLLTSAGPDTFFVCVEFSADPGIYYRVTAMSLVTGGTCAR